ncbi:MAG: winged helix-turn-helix domain-containing protein [Kiritimatiellae bacterium]|nr:winged helix-turn-helix domain-containing protein [Kiritimatiellia bacterium]
MRKTRNDCAWKRRTLGRPRKITHAHLEALRGELDKGAQAHGFQHDQWTLQRVAEVLYRLSEVRCHPAHVWKLLDRMNWSSPQPAGQAAERDDEAKA